MNVVVYPLVTIATALKDETVAVWKNALDDLRSCAPTNIRGMKKKVCTSLQWSYNHLEGDGVRSLFLLCACLSYYGDISMDQILSPEDDGDGSGVGASRLLFMVGDHKSVRMHDLVRDVARIIASKDPHPFKAVEDVPSDQDWTD